MNEVAHLPLKERRLDVFFAVVFAVTSGSSDAIPSLGIPLSAELPFTRRC